MSQGASDWYLRKPLILAVLGTSLSAGRLSGNLWWMRLTEAARAQPEAVGPIVMQNFGKGSQQSTYGVAMAPEIALFNPTHVLTEGFAINDCAALPTVISQPDHMANMQAIHDTLKAKNPAVDITWQTMNGVSAAGAALRPALQAYYDDEVTKAAAMGDRMLNHYYGLPTPPAPVGGWPKPLPDYLTDSGDGLHPVWDGALEVYFWPGMIYWLRVRMAEYWGLPIPNPPSPPTPPDANFLVAAGGGGGGAYVGAGGGAGGRRRAAANLSAMYGPVFIGFGGFNGSGSGPTSLGFSGDYSFISGVPVALGGGYGAGYAISPGQAGGDGGSGGGSYGPGVSGGGNVPGTGNVGGTGLNPNSMSGGGGGAGGPGVSGAGGGAGGPGLLADWPGAPGGLYICGGGPGVVYPSAPQAYPVGGGPTNYGGGGRAGDEASGAGVSERGGDGGAWIWYSGAVRATGGVVTSFGGFTVHQFTRADMSPSLRMTSNAAPAGYVAAASSVFSGSYDAFKAFNGGVRIPDNRWASGNGAAFPHTLSLRVPAAKAFKHYRTVDTGASATTPAAQQPKSWILEGSNDGVTWTLMDTRVNVPVGAADESRVWEMNGPGAGLSFDRWRWTISVCQGVDRNIASWIAVDLLPALAPL